MSEEVEYTLPQLQNLIKRDPEGYKNDFELQYSQYKNKLSSLNLKPRTYAKDTEELITFIAQVSSCYKDLLSDFPQELHSFLKKHAAIMNPFMRMGLVRALIMVRNKGLLPPTLLLELCFSLFKCQDKILRKMLYNYIVNDIKGINLKKKDTILNRTLQNYVYTMLQDQNKWAAKMSLDVMIELYRRNIWNDARTVNVIATACFSKESKVMVAALKFFLGKDTDDAESDSDDEDEKAPKKSAKELQLSHRVGKKTQKRKKKLERAMQILKRNQKKKKKSEVFNFSALHLIHDPQTFCEQLFHQLLGTSNKKNSTTVALRWEVKVIMMDLISRLIGIHQLILCEFYPYLKTRLRPRQQDVTKLLLFAAQASHELVPPDALEEVISSIANEFITERNSSDVMAVGLNAVREICSRCPLAISEDLLRDFVQYKNYRDKGVMMAARSLIHTYRVHNPHMLHKKDRGKPMEGLEENKSLVYGDLKTKDYVPGTEFLPETVPENQTSKNEGSWESCSDDDDDDDGEWIDVHHSSDEENAKKQPESAEQQVERLERAKEISSQRILSQEDYQAMQKEQAARQANMESSGSGKKRKHVEVAGDTSHSGELPHLSNIENIHKRRAHDRESRLQTVMAGRQDRPKYGHTHEKMNPNASTTNKQKQKNKAFMMVKYKVARKTKRSFHDKQVSLRNALLKRLKHSKR